MEYNVGDIVEYMYSPGVELTIIQIGRDPIMCLLSNGEWVFDSQLTLIKTYQPESKNNTTMIIIGVVIAYLFLYRG